MRYIQLISVAALAAALACTDHAPVPTATTPAFGSGGTTGSPQYKSSTYTLTSSFGLNHTWRQTGLGSFTTVPYLLSAHVTITAHCENKPGNTVQGTPFQIDQDLSTGPVPQTPHNGVINGDLTLAPSAVACQPPGGNPHNAVIDAAVYSRIEFCWGKTTPGVTDLQGPVPQGPGSGATVPPSPQSGVPLTGSEADGTGIFAACAST